MRTGKQHSRARRHHCLGLMAGGALGGVFGAALRLFPWYREDLIKTPFYSYDPISQSISALLFVGFACMSGSAH